MPQLELFPLVCLETFQAYCWNAHARAEALKGRAIRSQEQRLLGEISLLMLALEKVEREVQLHEARHLPEPARPPAILGVQHLRNLNQWPDLALQRARKWRVRGEPASGPRDAAGGPP